MSVTSYPHINKSAHWQEISEWARCLLLYSFSSSPPPPPPPLLLLSTPPPFWLRVRSRGTYIHMAKSGRQGWLRKSLLQQELLPVALPFHPTARLCPPRKIAFGKDTAISRPWRRAGTAAQKAVSAPVWSKLAFPMALKELTRRQVILEWMRTHLKLECLLSPLWKPSRCSQRVWIGIAGIIFTKSQFCLCQLF